MPFFLTCLAAAAAILASSPAFAHGGAHAEAAGWDSWFGDPTVAIILGVAATLYLGGLARMLSRPVGRWPVAPWRVVSFGGALAIIGLALLSPIDAFADKLFSVHMAQHLMLVLIAAPLIAISNAQLVYLWLLPLRGRRWAGRTFIQIPGVRYASTHAIAAAWIVCAAFVGSLWFWHAPATYNWALANKWGHASEHLVLLATSTAFWRVVATSGERRLSPGMLILMVSLVGIQGSFLAALIMFAPRPLYAAYAANSIDDQALGGVLMCIPASFLYLGSTIWALSKMLNGEKLRAAR
jgi:cytochrome c oxidase assembly factor CtaG